MSKNKGPDKYYKKQVTSNKDSSKKESYVQNDKVNLVNINKKDIKKARNSSKVSASITTEDFMQ